MQRLSESFRNLDFSMAQHTTSWLLATGLPYISSARCLTTSPRPSKAPAGRPHSASAALIDCHAGVAYNHCARTSAAVAAAGQTVHKEQRPIRDFARAPRPPHTYYSGRLSCVSCDGITRSNTHNKAMPDRHSFAARDPPSAAAAPPSGPQVNAVEDEASKACSSLGAAATTTTTTAAAAAASSVCDDEIARRIAASRARRTTRLSYNCPACSISAATPSNIARHMARCCPDLIQPDTAAWSQLDSLPRGYPSPQHDAAVGLLRAAGQREQELRRRVLACVFWSGPVDAATGLPQRLEAEEAARRLGLPLARASSVLQRAMAAVPLASDPGGPPLEVLYEDEHFLAVNKPPGLHTAPIHRFTGGSVVNKVIAYLNRGRKGVSGGTAPLTLLTPPPLAGDPCAAAAVSVPLYGGSAAVPELMPVPDPFTLSSSGSSPDQAAAAAGAGCTAPYQLEPYVLHRLDMNTSGLLLFAKRPEVVAGLHRQFRERTLSKLYVAAAVGCPAEGAELYGSGGGGGGGGPYVFHVDAPIDRHPTQAVARRVAQTGKEAATSFAVLACNPHADLGPSARGAPGLLFHERPTGHPSWTSTALEPDLCGSSGGEAAAAAAAARIPRGASLVVCAPHTGRTHQIRVHLHAAGHPIVGDDIYGVTGLWLGRQALHAASLHFTHPLTGWKVKLSAPLPPDMVDCLAALGLTPPDAAALAEAEAAWRRAGLAKGGGGGGEGRGAGPGPAPRRAGSGR